MGRVFTVNFNFLEQPCTALVSFRNQEGYNPAFSVHYLNKELEMVLPERKLTFSLANGIEHPETIDSKLAEDLVEKISEAISNYLQVYA